MKLRSPALLGSMLTLLGVVGWVWLREGSAPSVAVAGGVPREVLGQRLRLAAAGDWRAAAQDFDGWRERQRTGRAAATAELADGVTLARARMAALAALMRVDPAAALRETMTLDELAALPEAVRAECEQPFGAIASIDLLWAAREQADGTVHCEDRAVLHAGGRSWRAWGPHLTGGRPPRANVPVGGWLIDGEALVDPAPVRLLGPAERAVAGQWFAAGNPDGIDPLSGRPADPEVTALVGGRVYQFADAAAVAQVGEVLEAADRAAAADGRFELRHGLGWLAAEGGDDPGGEAPVAASSWMDDMLDVLFIRVDFSDFPGEPVSKAALESTLSSVNGHLVNYSYSKASLAFTVTPQVYRMPATGASYATSGNNDQLMADARTAAAANHTLANYDVVAVFFPSLSGVANSKITYGGLASVGGSNHWINGANSTSVILHEFGHNYGLFHANYWDPTRGIGGSYSVPPTYSLEYGDIFDRMGGGTAPDGYFSPYATRKLNWLPAAKVAEATATGTWRIHRFDDPNALSNQHLALRVPMGGSLFYWIGHRRRYGAPYNLQNGAYVVAEGLYPSGSGRPDRPNLIDMTPGSASPETNDRQDSGLTVGNQFVDAAAGVTIRVVAAGGTAPNEWIDVTVEFQSRFSLAAATVEVDEQAGVAWLAARRAFGTGAASVDYATAAGTATAGGDFLTTTGTVRWAAGDLADKWIPVPLRPDTLNEGSESFTVTLTNPVGGVLDTQATTTVNLLDPGVRFASFAPGFFGSSVNAIVPLPDGRVIIGGDIPAGIGTATAIRHLARLNPDGSVDPAFLTGSGFNGAVRALVRQPDGKLLAGGDFTSYNGTTCNRIVRLLPDGAVDTAFVAATGSGADSSIYSIAREPAGTILLGGELDNFNGAPADGLVRLTAGGARDAANPLTPGYSGFAGGARIRVVAVEPDGKLMIGGSFYYGWNGTGWRNGVARLHPDGSRDASFEPDAGTHGAGSTGTLMEVYSLARQPDGKYLLGGTFSAYDENPASRLARVNANGTFDATFAPPAFNNTVQVGLAQGGGRVLAGGWFDSPAGRVERLTTTGAVDPGFQQGSGAAGGVYALAEGPDGALWIGGNFFSYDGASSRPVVKVAGGVAPYDRWVAANFTGAQVAAGAADEDADPDGDGNQNLAEMVLGSDPHAANAGSAFGPGVGGGVTFASAAGQQYLQVAVARPGTPTGAWYAAQFSSDLANWLPADPLPGSNAVYQVIEDSASGFIVRDKTPVAGAARRFARIVLKLPQ